MASVTGSQIFSATNSVMVMTHVEDHMQPDSQS